MEDGLLELVNYGQIKGVDFNLKNYQRIDLTMFDQDALKEILIKGKFKNKGNVYDYPKVLPQPDTIGGWNVASDFKMFQRIAVSKKLNCIVLYSAETWYINTMFLVGYKKIKKFMKLANSSINQDTGANIFRDTNFDYEKDKYIEVMEPVNDDTKVAEVVRKKIQEEHLVFDKDSSIVQVMKDINNFFKEDTKVMYDKMEVAYKRGLILYGDPGNGKSAMIREIIRTTPDVAKIVINPNVRSVTNILAALLKALNGRKAIIIIEDIDSLITDRNRSEFLNILDGVDVKSGVCFIGTTNYPERIDPAFMNRGGRFDVTFHIENPSNKTRKKFFESKNLRKLFEDHKLNDQKHGNDRDIVNLFVKHTKGLPMASLKEVLTSTAILLASHTCETIQEAITKSSSTLTENRQEHAKSHNNFKMNKQMNMYNNGMMAPSVGQPFGIATATVSAELDDDEDWDDYDDESHVKEPKLKKVKAKRKKKDNVIKMRKVKVKRIV
jgi:ATPases of the AAA+ class